MTATYAQSRQDLISAFIPRAKAFAELIRNRHIQSYTQGHTNIKRYHPQKMDFGYLKDDFPVHHAEFTNQEIPGNQEAVKIWFNPWCYIAFYNIREKAGANAKVTRGPVEVIGTTTKGVARVPVDNNTDDPQPLERKFEVVKASGKTVDIGARASAAFRQLIKAGGEAASFSSETEITLEVEASTNVSNWHSENLADATTWSGIVPPHTRRILERTLSVGKARQQVIVDGELDYSVYVLSRGDFDVKFDSRDDLSAVLSGVGNTGKGGHYSDWARAYSVWRLPGGDVAMWIERIAGPVNARYVDYDESDQAIEEPISFRDEPLEG